MSANIKLAFVASPNGFLSEFVEASVEKPADGLNGDCIVTYSGKYSNCMMKVKLVRGKREGMATILNDGVPWIQLTYCNGAITGRVKRWNKWGQVDMRGMLVDGEENGLFEEYDRREAVVWRGYYQNGQRYSEVVRSGRAMGWYEERSVVSGNLWSIAQYDSGLNDKNGRCMRYENGEWVGEWMYKNGVKGRCIREYRNGVLSLYDINGKKTHEARVAKEEVKDGVFDHEPVEGMDGFYKEVVLDDRIASVAEYDPLRMKKNGKCFEMEDGKMKRVCVYENGVLKRVLMEFNGETMTEYSDTKKVYEGGFKGDMKKGFVREGKGKEYRKMSSNNGAVSHYGESMTLVGMWKNGQKNGEFYEVNNNEKVVRICVYENDEVSLIISEFNGATMTEYNDSGNTVYKGEFACDLKNGFKRNGNGKEYGNDRLAIYSGEWKKGKRDGLGTEYSQGFALYTGNWWNGVRNGEGKEMDRNGKVVFVGEWKDGKGKGKEMDGNGKVVYEGGWWNGRRNGRGIEMNGRRWVGHWNDGKMNGMGYERDANGALKRGCLLENGEMKRVVQVFNGKEMTEYDENGEVQFVGGYSGNVENGFVREGKGEEYGDGVETTTTGVVIKGKRRLVRTGNWNKGMKNGQSYEYDDKGEVNRVCMYENDRRSRVMMQFNGSVMTEYDMNGVVQFVGGFSGDAEKGFERCGKGKEYKNGGKLPVYYGNWERGKRNGMGIEFKGIMPTFWGKWKNGVCDDQCNGVAWIVMGIAVVIVISTIMIVHKSITEMSITSCNQLETISAKRSNQLEKLTFKKGCDCRRIVIGDKYFGGVRVFELDGLGELESVEIGENSLRISYYSERSDGSYRIVNCPKLKTLQVGDRSFSDYHSFELSNLPSLQSIDIGGGCFSYVSSFSMTGLIE